MLCALKQKVNASNSEVYKMNFEKFYLVKHTKHVKLVILNNFCQQTCATVKCFLIAEYYIAVNPYPSVVLIN